MVGKNRVELLSHGPKPCIIPLYHIPIIVKEKDLDVSARSRSSIKSEFVEY